MPRTADRQPRSAAARGARPALPRPAEPAAEPPLARVHRILGNAAVQRLLVQRSPSTAAGGPVSPEVEEEIGRARGGGSSLDEGVRGEMESAFGADFGGVRVHTGGRADVLNRALGARAFTTGRDVFFRGSEFSPSSPDGKRLLAHELAHVVQQGGSSAPVQRSLTVGPADDAYEREADAAAEAVAGSRAASVSTAGAEGVQRDDGPGGAAVAAPPARQGTPADAKRYFTNPAGEQDAQLAAALKLLARYEPDVKVADVQFRLFPAAEQTSHISGMTEGGRSHWDGRTPVIELTQEDLDRIEKHVRDPALVPVSEVYDVIRVMGHEMHHLWRAKKGHSANPIHPVYQAEATKRMEQIRQNWLEFIRDNPQERRGLGIPADKELRRWEDLPQAARYQIEKDASSTDMIEGLYQRTAYVVEEIYTKVEEVSFLRVQQQDTREPVVKASRQGLSELAGLIRRLGTVLDNSAASGELLTPALLTQTRAEMLAHLRKRYPNRADASVDSYEVIFYLASITNGLAPIYDGSGKVISRLPPEARPPK